MGGKVCVILGTYCAQTEARDKIRRRGLIDNVSVTPQCVLDENDVRDRERIVDVTVEAQTRQNALLLARRA